MANLLETLIMTRMMICRHIFSVAYDRLKSAHSFHIQQTLVNVARAVTVIQSVYLLSHVITAL